MRRAFAIFVALLFPLYLFAASLTCQLPAHVFHDAHGTASMSASAELQQLLAFDAVAQCDDDAEEPPAGADIEDSVGPALARKDIAFPGYSQPPYATRVAHLPFLPIIKPPPQA
ncbi:MAG: hypothetical protein ABWY05_18155 [Noviherbaspirillum sp.]